MFTFHCLLLLLLHCLKRYILSTILLFSFFIFIPASFSHVFFSQPRLSSRCLTTPHCLPTVLTPHLRILCYLPVRLSSGPHSPRPHNHFLLAFFFSGDIELNPGPSDFTVCMHNIRSILHPVHSAALSDITYTHYPDLFCLTESWIKPSTTSAVDHAQPPAFCTARRMIGRDAARRAGPSTSAETCVI